MNPNSIHNEHELLVLLKGGDVRAFEELYQLYNYRLYGNLLKLLKSEQEAEEILQEVFIKIWDKRAGIDIDKSFRSYLFRIAENMVYDYFRKAARNKKRAAHLLSIANPAYLYIEELLLEKENSALLQNAIASLSPQRRQVFLLCKVNGKSYKEVSELLGISVSTISNHIVTSTRIIRAYLNNNREVMIALLLITPLPLSL